MFQPSSLLASGSLAVPPFSKHRQHDQEAQEQWQVRGC